VAKFQDGTAWFDCVRLRHRYAHHLFNRFTAAPGSTASRQSSSITPQQLVPATLAVLHNIQDGHDRLCLSAKMSNHFELPFLVLVFFACAWWFNVEFPPTPWQTWWIVLIIESGLLWYSHQLTHLIWNGVEGTQCTIRRRCLAVSIILLSSILLVGYASCRNGRWVGIVTHDQEDMVGATAVAEILLGFFYFGCKS